MDDFADCNSYSADHDVPQKRRHYWPHILQSSGRKAGGALPWLLLIVLGCRGLGVGILAPVRRRYAGAGDDLTWSLTARRSVHRCRFARSMDPDAPCNGEVSLLLALDKFRSLLGVAHSGCGDTHGDGVAPIWRAPRKGLGVLHQVKLVSGLAVSTASTWLLFSMFTSLGPRSSSSDS